MHALTERDARLRPTRALIVDDNQELRELLGGYLTRFNIDSEAVGDGPGMRRALAQSHFDVIILDLMLPGEDGLALCRQVRAESDIPILMLTARCEPTDRIIGLELGADDYMAKPFEPRELVARIQTILRRVRDDRGAPRDEEPRASIRFDGWTLHCVLRQLQSPGGLVVPLSNAEFRLLWVFLERPRRVLSREQLLDEARGRSIEAFDRSIDLLVSRLRQKLGDDPRSPTLIKTVRGEGYLFDAGEIR
ncbi:response regulator [Aquipseudomonas alcaligenes]|uniref:Response regulator n=1 Tax=Aquipseudomonas alcaligenes TaxID=43263 RepID=A0AB73HTI0_AQUAC|nr:response regulator [Pseudomonas alcaligenes]MDH0141389.1 response regulator [Pseudomonas alcaligenes]